MSVGGYWSRCIDSGAAAQVRSAAVRPPLWLWHDTDVGAVHDSGGVILVQGDVGIGKSHLVRSALREAEAMGLTTLQTAASATNAAMPFYAWRHAIHQMLQPNHGADRAVTRGGRHRVSGAGAAGSPLRLPNLSWDSAMAEAAVLSVISPRQRVFAWLLNEVIPVKFAADAALRELSSAEQAARRLELLCTLIVSASKDLLSSFRCGERLLIVIEHADYLDPASVQLLSKVAAHSGA